MYNFDKQTVQTIFKYKLDIPTKFKKSFTFLFDLFEKREIDGNVSQLKWYEGKNYNWAAGQKDGVDFLFRKYGEHFMIYFHNTNKKHEYEIFDDKYGCIFFDTDSDKLASPKDYDAYSDNNYIDIDKYINQLVQFILDGRVWALWNDISFPREKHVDVSCVWINEEQGIYNFDNFILALEELFDKHEQKFAETQMFEKIKQLKVGDVLKNGKVVKSISVEPSKNWNGEIYYHSVGITFEGDKETFKDVYSLTRWDYDLFFDDKDHIEIKI